MNQQEFDVIIIGAGVAGLIAALEISLTGRSVAIIEAKEKVGGRIQTIFTNEDYPMELGAEFVHGNLPITSELLKKAGAKQVETDGSIWQHKDEKLSEQDDFIEDYKLLEKKFKEVTSDISVADFLEQHLPGNEHEELRFTLRNYVEGYYAADLNKASTFALKEELTKGDEEQFRINGGYQKLVSYLEESCVANGVFFFFLQTVTQLYWKDNGVEVITNHNSFVGSRAIVTVSIGVLQKDVIRFSPALPEKKAAAMQLGFGHVVKINLLFEDAFWKDKRHTQQENLSKLNFIFSQEEIPTWWTQHPDNTPLLTGWLGGPRAFPLQTLSEEELVGKAIASLSKIFNLDVVDLQKNLVQSACYKWSEDDHFAGAYSYAVIDSEKYMQQILEPILATLYFAGEGLHHGNEIGTVEAALQSGRTVAQQLIAQAKGR